jgi:uncharacterized protein (DUF2384 family)
MIKTRHIKAKPNEAVLRPGKGEHESQIVGSDLAPTAGRASKRVAGSDLTAKFQIRPSFINGFTDKGGVVDVDRVAETFRMSRRQLAQTIGLGHASVSKTDRRVAPKAQTRVTEMLEIIGRVRDWAGGETQAMAWYRSQPIPALDGRTPEALVKAGLANAVREYLDHIALGGFA